MVEDEDIEYLFGLPPRAKILVGTLMAFSGGVVATRLWERNLIAGAAVFLVVFGVTVALVGVKEKRETRVHEEERERVEREFEPLVSGALGERLAGRSPVRYLQQNRVASHDARRKITTEVDRRYGVGMIERAEAEMAAGRYQAACDLYDEAWKALAGHENAPIDPAVLWLQFSRMNALFLAGRHEGCLDVAHETVRVFAMPKFLGNPLFHLRVGQSLYELLDEQERALTGSGTMLDELGRALAAGGTEIFEGEDPKYLAAITAVQEPPVEGASKDVLDQARGHLRDLVMRKFGGLPGRAC